MGNTVHYGLIELPCRRISAADELNRLALSKRKIGDIPRTAVNLIELFGGIGEHHCRIALRIDRILRGIDGAIGVVRVDKLSIRRRRNRRAPELLIPLDGLKLR